MRKTNLQPIASLHQSPTLSGSPALLHDISDAIIATDMNFHVVFFNRAAEELYAIPASEILGKPLGEMIQYEFYDTSLGEALQHLTEQGRWQGKVSFTRRDGKTIVFLGNISYITDNKGRRSGIVGVNKDITEIEEIQKKSRQYKLRMKSILNGTKEALFLVDADYKLLLLNNSARAFLKKFMNQEPEPGCNFLSILPEHRREVTATAIKKALQGEDTEYEVHYSGGLWCLVNYTAVLNEYTDQKEICISARDITQRKLVEEELNMLSLLARETENGVMITDENSLITWVNESFIRVYGYSVEELIGHNPERLFTGPETDRKTLQQIKEHVGQGRHFNCELASYHKNGNKLWLRLDMQPVFDENKKLSKYFVILTDLTEQHLQKEKEIKNKIDQQKKLNRLVLKTQENISMELGRELHDNINQILTAARLQLEFAESNPQSNSDFIARGRTSVEEALKEIRRLSRQLTAPRFNETDLLQEIHELLENLRLEAITHLDISDFDEKLLSPEVKLHIFRILQEQLKNIIKYSEATEVSIVLRNCKNNFCLTIKDNGVGFDTKQKKNGIGLTNIRNRVESYNGTLEIQSFPGEGCTVTAKIPMHKD